MAKTNLRSTFFVAAVLLVAVPTVDAGSVDVGTTVRDLELGDVAVLGPTVVVFFGVECPLARLYGGRLCELAEQYKGRVTFIGVDSNQRDSLVEIEDWKQQYAPTLKLLYDPDQSIADKLGATRNPEVILLDGGQQILYRGRIDDQYTTTAKKGKAVRHDLDRAIKQVLAGKPVSVPVTVATGCYIDRRKPIDQSERSEVTYHQHIAPILRRRCVNCHRAGQSAPLELTTFEEAYSWIDTIEEVVREKRMPPWYANPDHGEFQNFAGLTETERDLIERWAEASGPEGDPATAAAIAPLPSSEWNIGKPARILKIPEPFTVPASGLIDYQYFVVDPGFAVDKWVSAVEVRAGNSEVVHHCNVFVEPPTLAAFSLESWSRLPSSYLAVTAPGRPPMTFPSGMAKHIPAGSKLIFQIHYQSIGSIQTDQTSIGFKFADPKQVKREVATRGLIAGEDELQIPAGEANYQVRLSQKVHQDLLLLALTPHMHLRGKSCRYIANYIDGTSEVLLDIPYWDFNWQDRYVLESPKRLPTGTEIIAEATFDNSSANPFNPDSTATVTYGPQSTDEMFNAWYEAVLVDQDLSQPGIVQFWKGVPVKKIFFPMVACAALVICCRFLPAHRNA